MIDGIRISLASGEELLESIKNSGYRDGILSKKKLHDDSDTGYRSLNVDALDFRIGLKRNHIKGSIHKWYNIQRNLDEQNYNDFTFSDVVNAIDMLALVTGSDEMFISRLEFGFNIETNLCLDDVIKNSFLFYNKSICKELSTFNGKGLLKRFETSKYDFKVYDKGLQYDLNNEKISTLRIEIVYKTSSELEKLKIRYLKDLKNKSKVRGVFLDFLKKFNKMTILDNFDTVSDASKTCMLYKYSNPIYWNMHFKKISSSFKHRKYREFNTLLSELDLVSTKNLLINKLKEKYIYLINN